MSPKVPVDGYIHSFSANERNNMKETSHQYMCNVVTTSTDFLFDYEKMCSVSPYFTNYDNHSSGFYIESITFDKNKLHVVGWAFRNELNIEGIEPSEYLLERKLREDVTAIFELEDDLLVGFILQVNCKDGLQFSLSNSEVEVKFEINLTEKPLENEVNESQDISKNNDELLIVGGAPTVRNFKKEIANFKGDIWALNDSIFWLENENIKVNNLVISDQRFIEKNLNKLPNIKCNNFIAADYISFDNLTFIPSSLYRIEIVGRTGISDSKLQAFHGCTVAHLALQLARMLNYRKITTTGVILGFPINYERIDGSRSMPEYVHNVQVENVKAIVQALRDEDIEVLALESESNINYF